MTTQNLDFDSAKKEFLDKVDKATSEYRQKVRDIAKSLEDKRLNGLKDDLGIRS